VTGSMRRRGRHIIRAFGIIMRRHEKARILSW